MQNINRGKIIIRTGIIGIATNVLLAAFKAVVGLFSNSVAVILDAVNNLSDALSSLITIIGTKLARRSPDRNHPMGHGRTEYLTASLISIIVMYAGITSLVESVKKIISPDTPDYSTVSLIIIAVAIVVKLILGRYVKAAGEKADSDALRASGSDALFDAIISTSTLVAAIVFKLTNLSLEAYLAAAISLYIIYSGIGMLRDTLSEIIGKRVDPELSRKVKECVTSFDEVLGAYDLIIHNYGPEQLVASVHIELPDSMTVGEADTLERAIADKVYSECGVIITGISLYSKNTKSTRATELETIISEQIKAHPTILGMHGFYLDDTTKQVRFDIIVSFDEKDRRALCSELTRELSDKKPEYKFTIVTDYDITD